MFTDTPQAPHGAEKPMNTNTNDHAEKSVFKLSPLSLIANTITFLRNVIFPIVAVAFATGSQSYVVTIVVIISLIIIALSFFTWLSWKRFTYQIGAEEILITSGIISRNARSIPYERIQDVSIEQKLIPRILNIAAVKFETGGSKGDEGSLEYVSFEEAENLRQLIRARKAGAALAVTVAKDTQNIDIEDSVLEETIKEDETIFSMDAKRIFTLGFFNFSLVIFAIIAGAIQQFDFLLPGDIEDAIGYIKDSVGERSDQIQAISLATQIFGIASLLFSVIIIGMLSGQLQTFLREYGFTLTETDRGIRRKRGLITLTDVVMPLHRVQAAIIKTGPIRKRFGWKALKFTSLGSDTGKESSHMMAPLAKEDEYWPIAQRANILSPKPDTPFFNVHISHALPAIFIGLIFACLALVEFIFGFGITVLKWIWLIAPITMIIGFLNWRYHNYAMDDDQIYVRTGFWSQKMTILPIIKAQSVDITQGPIERLCKVANVKFGIAGGSGLSTLTVHNIPVTIARDIQIKTIYAAKNIGFSQLIQAPQ